jgi:hypothetical protein
MRKVDQTSVVKGEGNCMQAVVASLLELDLKKVPNFIKYVNHKTKDPYWEMYVFMEKHGYKMSEIDIKVDDMPVSALDITEIDGGVNGYFYATVPSQTFTDVNHAVVVDKDLNIVHDPNPNRLALDLIPEDIISFFSVKDNWYFGIDGKLKKDKKQ